MTATVQNPAPVVGGRTSSWFAPGGWPAFLLRRFAVFLLSLWALVTAAFLMLQLIPGDPVRQAVGMNASVEIVESMRTQLGLDLPLWEQYLRFIGGLLTGDPGDSILLRMPVTQVIADRLPATLELALITIVVVLLLAVPIGIGFAALTRGGRRRGVEIGYTAVSGVLAVVPEFLFGVGLVYVFAVNLQLLPVAGRSGPESYILPVAALAIGAVASLSRIVRAEALSVLDTDYLRTARAKRMPSWMLYLRHALPNLLTPTLTMAGIMLGTLIAGTVLVESIFAWPGLGLTLVSSISDKDYPLAQTLVVVYGGMVLLVNLAVDVVLALVDPRSTIKDV